VKILDGGRSQTAIHFALDQLAGDGVVVLQERHVVVYIGVRLLPLRKLIPLRRQRLQRRPVDRRIIQKDGAKSSATSGPSENRFWPTSITAGPAPWMSSTTACAWLEHAYHRTEHNALGTTPLLRWQRDIDHIRQLPPATDLRRLSSTACSGWCAGIALS
jgi:hypothetical protein